VTVIFAGESIADTRQSLRVLETSGPPVYYVPPADVRSRILVPNGRTSVCEWKGIARYWDVVVGDRRAPNAAWTYPEPARGFEAITDHVAFYPARVDACYVDGERVRAQDGDFYGGWITSDVVGPFKGGPGTEGW
jgi:uncharacterized protein (DUF427 family)